MVGIWSFLRFVILVLRCAYKSIENEAAQYERNSEERLVCQTLHLAEVENH